MENLKEETIAKNNQPCLVCQKAHSRQCAKEFLHVTCVPSNQWKSFTEVAISR